MNSYSNVSGESNITGYENGRLNGDMNADLFIRVQFADGSTYTYTESSCGLFIVESMIALAEQGAGLNGYISKNRPCYASKS